MLLEFHLLLWNSSEPHALLLGKMGERITNYSNHELPAASSLVISTAAVEVDRESGFSVGTRCGTGFDLTSRTTGLFLDYITTPHRPDCASENREQQGRLNGDRLAPTADKLGQTSGSLSPLGPSPRIQRGFSPSSFLTPVEQPVPRIGVPALRAKMPNQRRRLKSHGCIRKRLF